MAPSHWRVVLFRAVRDGDVGGVKSIASSHPASVHDFFTKHMSHPELEWESLQWYEFQEATCLYIVLKKNAAASYCQKTVVEWLLENGVSPTTRCYCDQTPLDVVGQCRFDSESASSIRFMLKRPSKVPRAPLAPSVTVKAGMEDVSRRIVQEFDRGPGLPVETKVVEVVEPVKRCQILASFQSYWLPPGTQYEVRYRREVRSFF